MKNFAIFVGGGVVVGVLVYILMRRAVMRAQVGIQDGTKQSNPTQKPPNPAFASGQPLPTLPA